MKEQHELPGEMTQKGDRSGEISQDSSDQEVILLLDAARTKGEDAQMHELIAELQARCVYPKETVPKNTNTVFQMVEGWGVRWYRWSGTLQCQHCNVDLRDHENGPPFKREIGFYNRDRDRTEYYICPECKGRIER